MLSPVFCFVLEGGFLELNLGIRLQLFCAMWKTKTLSEIFQGMLHDLGLGEVYVIIDALDECETGLPQLLDSSAPGSRTIRTVGFLAGWVHFSGGTACARTLAAGAESSHSVNHLVTTRVLRKYAGAQATASGHELTRSKLHTS